MKKLSWLKVGQHQFQKNVTHRLTLVLVDGRDNECVFSCLIGVFLLAVTSSIASSTKLLAQSIPCFVSDCRGHVSTPKSRGYRKSNRELPFPAFGASFYASSVCFLILSIIPRNLYFGRSLMKKQLSPTGIATFSQRMATKKCDGIRSIIFNSNKSICQLSSIYFSAFLEIRFRISFTASERL